MRLIDTKQSLIVSLACFLVVGCGGAPSTNPDAQKVEAPIEEVLVAGIPAAAVEAFQKGVRELSREPADFGKAASFFEAAIQADDTYVVARLNLAYSYERLGRYADAAAQFQKLVDARVVDRGVTLALGRALLKSGEGARAITEFESVLRKNADDLEARNNLAAAYLSKGDLETSLRYVKEVLSVQPRNVPAIQNLGLIYLTEKKLPLARLMFDKALGYEKGRLKDQSTRFGGYARQFIMKALSSASGEVTKGIEKLNAPPAPAAPATPAEPVEGEEAPAEAAPEPAKVEALTEVVIDVDLGHPGLGKVAIRIEKGKTPDTPALLLEAHDPSVDKLLGKVSDELSKSWAGSGVIFKSLRVPNAQVAVKKKKKKKKKKKAKKKKGTEGGEVIKKVTEEEVKGELDLNFLSLDGKLFWTKAEEKALIESVARCKNSMGLTYYSMGNTPAAVLAFNKAIELDPTMDEARLNVGSIYLDYLDYKQSLKQFTAVRERFPRHYHAMVGQAGSLYGVGEYQKAVDLYAETLEIRPTNSEALYRSGKIYEEQLNSPAKALSYYEKFVEVASPAADHKIHMMIKGIKAAMALDAQMKAQPAAGADGMGGEMPADGAGEATDAVPADGAPAEAAPAGDTPAEGEGETPEPEAPPAGEG